MSDCLFCRIINREIPATIVAENEHALAFRDIAPRAPTHVLVVPKAHIATMDDAVDPNMVGHVLLLAASVARQEGIVAGGYRTVLNTNAGAGQTVFHLHAHVLGGRVFDWPPG
ncbi:MAG: histidine triad nucleotide-binding protein [Gemmatimonadaceae bacterium]